MPSRLVESLPNPPELILVTAPTVHRQMIKQRTASTEERPWRVLITNQSNSNPHSPR
jgi:hypothetical protein